MRRKFWKNQNYVYHTGIFCGKIPPSIGRYLQEAPFHGGETGGFPYEMSLLRLQ